MLGVSASWFLTLTLLQTNRIKLVSWEGCTILRTRRPRSAHGHNYQWGWILPVTRSDHFPHLIVLNDLYRFPNIFTFSSLCPFMNIPYPPHPIIDQNTRLGSLFHLASSWARGEHFEKCKWGAFDLAKFLIFNFFFYPSWKPPVCIFFFLAHDAPHVLKHVEKHSEPKSKGGLSTW